MADIDLVIFDLDGTLVDTAPDIAAALGGDRAGGRRGGAAARRREELVGDGARELIRRALAPPARNGDLDDLFAAFLAQYRAHVSDRSAVYPGVTKRSTGCATPASRAR